MATAFDHFDKSGHRVQKADNSIAYTGGWTSEDWIGFAGGDPHLSRFVGNSSTNVIDPSGQFAEEIVWGPHDLEHLQAYIIKVARENRTSGSGNDRDPAFWVDTDEGYACRLRDDDPDPLNAIKDVFDKDSKYPYKIMCYKMTDLIILEAFRRFFENHPDPNIKEGGLNWMRQLIDNNDRLPCNRDDKGTFMKNFVRLMHSDGGYTKLENGDQTWLKNPVFERPDNDPNKAAWEQRKAGDGDEGSNDIYWKDKDLLIPHYEGWKAPFSINNQKDTIIGWAQIDDYAHSKWALTHQGLPTRNDVLIVEVRRVFLPGTFSIPGM